MPDQHALRDALHDLVADVDAGDTLRRRIERRRRRPALALAAAGVAVLALLAAAIALIPDDRDQAPVMTTPGVAEGWRSLAPMPIAPRSHPGVVWTGSEILVWGGDRVRPPAPPESSSGGARYDLGTDRWRTMSAAPIESRANPVAAWTGEELLIWSGQGDGKDDTDGAAYNPETDEWRRLPKPPIPERAWAEGVWTGSELIVWGGYNPAFDGTDGTSNASGDGAAYDPRTNRWRRLPPAPIEARFYHGMTWTGSEVLVWGGATGDGAEGRSFDDGALYDPRSDSWREMPPGPVARSNAVQIWTGRELLVWGGYDDASWFNDGARFTPATASWATIPAAPRDAPGGMNVGATGAWSGDRLLVWPDAAAFDPVTGAWDIIEDGPGGDAWADSMLWTDRDLVVLFGDDRHPAAYRPTPDARGTTGADRLARDQGTCGNDSRHLLPTWLPEGWSPEFRSGLGGAPTEEAVGHWRRDQSRHVTVVPNPDPRIGPMELGEPVEVLGSPAKVGTIHEGYGVYTACGFSLLAYGISAEDLRRFAEGLVDVSGGFAIWPESSPGAVRAGSASELPAWRADPVETAVRFAVEQLGWDGAAAASEPIESSAIRVRVGDGDREIFLTLEPVVTGRYSVVAVSTGWEDAEFTLGVGLREAGGHVYVKTKPGITGVDGTYGRGGDAENVSATPHPDGGWELVFNPVGRIEDPGHLLLRFHGADGRVASAWGMVVAPGEFAAG